MADSAHNNPATDGIDLHPLHIACPHCGADHLRVDHAPDYADMLLYCTNCSRRAEVAFGDPVYAQIVAQTDSGGDGSGGRAAVVHTVEQRLRPCVCGGRFRADAPRRCCACDSIVLAGAPNVDLWPGYCDFDMEQRMPSPEEVERINAFDASHIRRDDLWEERADGIS